MLRASFVKNFNQNVKWGFRKRLHNLRIFENHNGRLIEVSQQELKLSPFEVYLERSSVSMMYLATVLHVFLWGCGYKWQKPKDPSSKPVKDKFRTSNHKNIIELVKNDTK